MPKDTVFREEEPQPEGMGFDTEEAVRLLPALRAFAQSLTRDAPEAEDLVQETLLRAFRARRQFRRGTNLRAWLFTIMRNAFYSSRVRAGREAIGPEDCVSATAVTPASQEWVVRGKEAMFAVRRLPEHYRDLFVLVVMLGESYEDSAARCDIRVGTVKSRVNRARQMVRDSLGDDGP